MTEEAIHRPRLSYCAAEVREHDPDRYLVTLFASAEAREALFALYAFDHEIAKVRHIVSEPIAGMVRFQWWRDALDTMETGKPPAHPVVGALHSRWGQYAALRPRFDAAIDAREAELTSDSPDDLAALARRLEGGYGEITLAAVELLGAGEGPTHAAARHLGLALGLARLLQSLASDWRHDRIRLPRLLLDRHNVDPGRPGQTQDSRALSSVVAELAGRAREHLRDARRYRRAVPKQALPAMLHATLLDDYLKRLARAGHDPFCAVATRPAAWALLKLLGQRALGRY